MRNLQKLSIDLIIMISLAFTLESCELVSNDCDDEQAGSISTAEAGSETDNCETQDMGAPLGGDEQTAGEVQTAGDEQTAGNEGGGTAGSEGGDMGSIPLIDDGWQVYRHPCVGNRTDALHCDDKFKCYVGCGTTTEGRGTYMTTDGGVTWQTITTIPEGILDLARVNDISRSADGKLYFAGEIANETRVISMDTQGNLVEIFNRGTTSDFSFAPGTFRRSESGRAIAESLTGSDIIYRSSDSDDPNGSWTSGRDFCRDGDADDVPSGVQLLSIEVLGDDFYGVGSTINSPNTIFLPKWDNTDFDFHILQFNHQGLGAFTGELWDIDVSTQGIVAGGVNQTMAQGTIYTHTGGPNRVDPSTWNFFDVSSVIPNQSTWVTGVCMSDQAIIAVGRESREGWGFVLRSTDGGRSFEDISPRDENNRPYIPNASGCVVKDNTLIITGAGGLFAVYDRL